MSHQKDTIAFADEQKSVKAKSKRKVVHEKEQETEAIALNAQAGYVVPDIHQLAGVDKGQYPFQLLLDNNTPSALAFPELGEQKANHLPAFSQNTTVVFTSENMVHQFSNNLKELGLLLKWNNQFGVFLKKGGH